jgi:hypothetical protein
MEIHSVDGPCYLLRLPLELRRRIFSYLLTSNPFCRCTIGGERERRRRKLPEPKRLRLNISSLRQTNRQIREEALAFYLEENRFALHKYKFDDTWLAVLPDSTIAHIRRVQLHKAAPLSNDEMMRGPYAPDHHFVCDITLTRSPPYYQLRAGWSPVKDSQSQDWAEWLCSLMESFLNQITDREEKSYTFATLKMLMEYWEDICTWRRLGNRITCPVRIVEPLTIDPRNLTISKSKLVTRRRNAAESESGH